MSLPPAYFFKKNTVLMLKSFIYAFEFKSLTKAAALLNLPVSSISRYISELEESLGYDLLIKVKGKIALTPNGERLYRQANKHLKALEKAMINLEVKQKVIRFATYASAISYVAPLLLKHMQVLLPNVLLEVKVLSKKDCEAAISKGEMDMGLYAYYNDEEREDKSADLMYKYVGGYYPMIAVHKDNPFNLRHTEDQELSIEYALSQPELMGKFFYTGNFMFKELLVSKKQKDSIMIHPSAGIDILKRLAIDHQGFFIIDKESFSESEKDLFRFYKVSDRFKWRRFVCFKDKTEVNIKIKNILTVALGNKDVP